MKNSFTDTYKMSADKDKIKNMERKLRDVMDRFGVRTPLYRRAAAGDGFLQIASQMRTEMNIERLLARISEFAEAQRAAKGELIVWCDELAQQSPAGRARAASRGGTAQAFEGLRNWCEIHCSALTISHTVVQPRFGPLHLW
jgi:hypothetical protein